MNDADGRQPHAPSGRPPNGGMLRTHDLMVDTPSPMTATLGGYPWLPRMTDKARAARAGTLGDYLSPCPVDRRLLGLLGLGADRFADIAVAALTAQDLLTGLIDAGAGPSGRRAVRPGRLRRRTPILNTTDRRSRWRSSSST